MAELPVKSDILNRQQLERRFARELGKSFADQYERLLNYLGDPPDPAKIPISYWDDLDATTRAALAPIMADIYKRQILQLIDDISFGVDWALVNEWAITWAKDYSFELVSGINSRTRSALAKAIEVYQRDGLSKDDLAQMIEPLFGPVRAEMIATTETTRAAVQGELSVVKYIETNNPNIKMVAIWQTANDEHTCEICEPRNGKILGDGWTDPPPAHPRCRCWLNYEMTVVEK